MELPGKAGVLGTQEDTQRGEALLFVKGEWY
jgi:hypothetical protein